MKVGIILNGISRKKRKFYDEVLPPLKSKFDVTVFETQQANHAITLASEATAQNYDVILAAGGDGTLNQVLNGMLAGKYVTDKLPALGVIPLGTGNDFAKMCGVHANGNQLVTLLTRGVFPLTDVGKISCFHDHEKAVTKYFINVCSLGMGPEVVKRLRENNRALGPGLTYLMAITQTFFNHKPQPVFVKSEHWEWSGLARVVAIANGQSFGNSLFIAPGNQPDDGVFSAFIAGDLPLFKFLLYLQTIKSGKKLVDRKIHYHTCGPIELSSSQKTVVEAEGELQGYLPAKVDILHHRIAVVR